MTHLKGTARKSQPSAPAHSNRKAAPATGRVLRSGSARAVKAAPAAVKITRSKVTKPKLRRRADPWTPKRKPKVNPNPRPRSPPATHFTCRICVEEQPVAQFIKWVGPRRNPRQGIFEIPFSCIAHLARNPRKKNIDPVCRSCIGNAMSAKVDFTGARTVNNGCLEPGCNEYWHHDFVMKFMPDGEPLEKFNMDMFDVWLTDSRPKPMKCIGPECTAIGIPDSTAAGFPQVTCTGCSVRACAQCLVPWHKDLTCAEFAAKNIDKQMTDPEKDTLKLMQTKNGKRCPNCQLIIEKDGGCDSMYCMGCRKYFNWLSAAPAVLGSQKPMAIVVDSPYWVPNPNQTCEMDGIQGVAGPAGATQPVATTT